MSVKPITPSEAIDQKTSLIPDIVFTSFNDLISENIDVTGEALVKQKDVVKRIMDNSEITEGQIYKGKYLDIEDFYRKSGWAVTYDKPAYYEDYDAFFIFRKKRKSRT